MDAEVINAIRDLEDRIKEVKAERGVLLDSFRELASKGSRDNAKLKDDLISLVVELDRKIGQSKQSSKQENIINGGGGGADFSLRYRNDTERSTLGLSVSDPPIHRLEWIARDSATYKDEDGNDVEWPNDRWKPVLHGEYVIYPGDSP